MKRNEQLIENTWKIEDIYPNLDVFYKELEIVKTQSKELLKYKDHLTNASSLYAYLKGYEELNEKISDPEVIANQNEWKKLMKEHADIEEIVEKYREYKKIQNSIDDLKEMLEDKNPN